jgi:hypothetical protein
VPGNRAATAGGGRRDRKQKALIHDHISNSLARWLKAAGAKRPMRDFPAIAKYLRGTR